MADQDFLREEEAYLFNRGELQRSYTKFGAHVLPEGVHFAVWAPHASRVSVVGSFNGWNGENHAMHKLDSGKTGVWVLFVPDLGAGEHYKYEVVASDGSICQKADPFAFFSELRPQTASITYSLEGYKWSKASRDWEKRKRDAAGAGPLLIYEVHFASWRQHPDGSFYTYRELADTLVPYVQEMGYTHLEIMPVMEHPLDASWGYQITGYYSTTSRYGTPHDFMYFMDKCHQAGIAVILDWVPGHFCRDSHGLGRFDGKPLFDGGDHADWGTYRFDFDRAEVWSFLISNALFWFDLFKIDGLRVDGVTSMLHKNFMESGGYKIGKPDEKAVAFLRALNEAVASSYPGRLMIAEESSEFPRVSHPAEYGGLGFSYKWNMGWMNDTLRYSEEAFEHRFYHHDLLTFSMMYAFSENFILPFSHDEVVHGKKSLHGRMPGDYWQTFAGLRALYLYFIAHPGKKLCFMGTELATYIEWRFYEELEWFLLDYDSHRSFKHFVAEANKFYQGEELLWADDGGWHGFDWIDADNREQSVLCFLRRSGPEGDHVLVVLNMTPTYYPSFRIGTPFDVTPDKAVDEAVDATPGKKLEAAKATSRPTGKSAEKPTGKSASKSAKKPANAQDKSEPIQGYLQVFNSDDESYGGSGKGNDSFITVEPIPWHNRPSSIEIVVPPLAGIILKPIKRDK